MDGYCESQTEHIKTIFEWCVVSGFRYGVGKNCIATQINTVLNF